MLWFKKLLDWAISSQVPKEPVKLNGKGSTTIPEGSTLKRVEVRDIFWQRKRKKKMEMTKENIEKLTDEQKSEILIYLNKTGYDNYYLANLFNITVKALINYLKELNSYYKKCNSSDCLQPIKLYTEFTRNKNTDDGCEPRCKDCLKQYYNRKREHILKYHKEYRENNVEQSSDTLMNWRNNNQDYIKQYNQQYYLDNKEELIKHNHEYYKENREEILEKHIDYNLEHKSDRQEYNQFYNQNNKAKKRANNKKYKINKTQATPSWADLKKIEEIYQQAIDLEKLDGIKRHVDHIIPLYGVNENGEHIVCGLHVETNLQILTESENLHKKNKFNNAER